MKKIFNSIKRICFIQSVLLAALLPLFAQTQPPPLSPAMTAANQMFQQQKWSESAAAYEAVTKAEPANARAWFQLGWSRHGLGQYETAIDAFQKAMEINKGTPRAVFSIYAIAVMYAGMKENDKAIEWLGKALDANYSSPRQISIDPNLAGLRADPRFGEIQARAEKAADVCMSSPEYRAFDFWVGEWNVFTPQGQQAGTNKVERMAGGCIIAENWETPAGNIGKSFNFYNPSTKKWHQSYMDNNAGNWMMDGELKDGVLRYEGTIYAPGGNTLVHMTFYNMGPDKVRQTAETSTDNGKTWTPVWDGMYIRKKS